MPYSPSLATLEKDCRPNQKRILLFSPAFCNPQSPERRPLSLAVQQQTRPFSSMRPGCLRGAEHRAAPGPGEGHRAQPGRAGCSRRGATAGTALSLGGQGRLGAVREARGLPEPGTGGGRKNTGTGGRALVVTGGRWRGNDGDRGWFWIAPRGGALPAKCWARCPLLWGNQPRLRALASKPGAGAAGRGRVSAAAEAVPTVRSLADGPRPGQ